MALEDRLKQIHTRDGSPIQWLRKRVGFERFLARLQALEDSPWVLKGAFALDLRFGRRARTTRDLDLGIGAPLAGTRRPEPTEIGNLLREGAGHALPDFFAFAVGEADVILQEPTAQAYRFTVRASLADRPFDDFRVDVGTGLPTVAPIEEIPESDTLAFAGITPTRFRAVSLAQHFAEKVHALTFPWKDRENTRVKDLLDLALILKMRPPDPGSARSAVEAVFNRRDTHPLPLTIPDPPPSWSVGYSSTAAELGFSVVNMDEAVELLRTYWVRLFP